jgi:hypothetical protein
MRYVLCQRRRGDTPFNIKLQIRLCYTEQFYFED